LWDCRAGQFTSQPLLLPLGVRCGFKVVDGAGDAQSLFNGLFEALVGVFNGFLCNVQAGGNRSNNSCRNRIYASPFLDRSEKFGGFEERDEYTFYKQGIRRE
jgi:hypothetical protein